MESTKYELLAINGSLLISQAAEEDLFVQFSMLVLCRDLHSKCTMDGSIGRSFARLNKPETFLLLYQRRTYPTGLHPHETVAQPSSRLDNGKFLMLLYEKVTTMSLDGHLSVS
jgi:hypothetical protein